jgi:hypothetical protein
MAESRVRTSELASLEHQHHSPVHSQAIVYCLITVHTSTSGRIITCSLWVDVTNLLLKLDHNNDTENCRAEQCISGNGVSLLAMVCLSRESLR